MGSYPYDRPPSVPSFTLTSTDVAEGERLPAAQRSGALGVPGGTDTSPQLSWSSFPEGTRSFVITMYDPDAPTPSGFWHWAVADIPATTTELASGAGDGPGLPEGAFQLRNDARLPRYVGAAPPPGTGKHRYQVAVHALDVDSVSSIGVGTDSTPAALISHIRGHVLARATITPWAGEA